MKKNLFLQFLRGYAAFLVVYEHLFSSYLKEILNKENIFNEILFQYVFNPLGIDNLGGLGVVQFFLLSGFVITMVAMRESRFEFALKRFFRIFPPILFSLFIISIMYITLISLNLERFINIHSNRWPSLVNTNNFGLDIILKNLFLIKINLNLVLWTLRIEVLFYFFVFLFLFHLKNNPKKLYLFVVIFYTIFAFCDYIFQIGKKNFLIQNIYMQFEYLPYLLLGSLFYLYYSKIIDRHIFILFSLFFILFLTFNNLYKYIFLSYLLLVIGVYCNNKIRIPKKLSFLGDVSYSTYLNHQTVGTVLMGILIYHLGYNDIKMLLYFVLLITLVYILSIISYYLVEVPSQKFVRNIIAKWKK